MLRKFLLLASLVSIANCGETNNNNIPQTKNKGKVIDCSTMDVCEITLIVEAATTMTYYSENNDIRELRGYRAIFNNNGELELLRKNENISNPIPPIQTDGEFRPIITINGHMPGPMIVANENQTLVITVHNELKNVEGISIHWHGIHHRHMKTHESDGVAYITQHPISPYEKFTYKFLASPPGTHWYHAHSGAQRTDGLYGALIVNDKLPEDMQRGENKITDSPPEFTLILMDWQKDASIELFQIIGTSLRYWKEPGYQQYNSTRGPDNTEVGPMPFWSGIINDKGRHFNNLAKPNIANPGCSNLNCFYVIQGNIYRFRIIGAQALYPFRFSIQNHTFTVVATDGAHTEPIYNVNYLIVNTGERYDILVNTKGKTANNYWIFAEALEDVGNSRNEMFYSPIRLHRAEAILHYNETASFVISPDNNFDGVTTWTTCTTTNKCIAVNCPFSNYKDDTITCINLDSDNFLSHSDSPVPAEILSSNIVETLFFSFGFDGENSTAGSSVDGVNFRFPANPPLIEYTAFRDSNDACQRRGCDHEFEPYCACTQVIDISNWPRNSVIEMVITNRDVDSRATNPNGTSHPVHLHGHYFYVVDIGYPNLDSNNQFMLANNNISCIVNANDTDNDTSTVNCPRNFINVEGEGGVLKQEINWTNGTKPSEKTKQFPRKDILLLYHLVGILLLDLLWIIQDGGSYIVILKYIN